MKFKIQRKQLFQHMQNVVNIISSKTVIPILSGIKIDVKKEHITLTGSNSDITVQTNIPSKENEEDIITNIEARSIVLTVPQFPEIINKLPEDIVDITVEDNFKTVITSGSAVFTLYGQSSEEYPKVNLQQTEEQLRINVDDFKKVIKQTVFAVSTMETRPILTGVNIKLEDNQMTFTATDSHRLSTKTINAIDNNLDTTELVIPGKSLQELNKILDTNYETVNVSVIKNQIIFFTNNLYFSSRLLSGNYPETSRLIPQDSETILRIYTREFIHTIERAALLSNKDQNNVIDLETKQNNIIHISSKLPEVGNVNEQLTAISIDGEQVKISFSSKYMLDTLKTMDSEIVEINFTGAMRPFVIKAPDDPHILQLILPVKTF